MAETGHNGLGHPLEVHVAGEDRDVCLGDPLGGGGRLTIGDNHVYKELKYEIKVHIMIKGKRDVFKIRRSAQKSTPSYSR